MISDNKKLEEFKDILNMTPITASFVEQVDQLISRYGEEYISLAQKVLHLLEKLGLDCGLVSMSYSYDYLQQLDYYVKKGDYGHKNFGEVRKNIYDNKSVMLETYMPGLLSAYAYTTILYEKYHIFLNEFIPKLSMDMDGIEIGYGEGFYLWELFNHLPNINISGFDISPYAKEFAANVLSISGVNNKNYSLNYGNVIEGLKVENSCKDFGIMAELIEHIPEPQKAINEMGRILRPGGWLYLTTVKDSNHMDHMSNFLSIEEVDNMIFSGGFTIIKKSVYRIQDDNVSTKDRSIGLAYVATKN